MNNLKVGLFIIIAVSWILAIISSGFIIAGYYPYVFAVVVTIGCAVIYFWSQTYISPKEIEPAFRAIEKFIEEEYQKEMEIIAALENHKDNILNKPNVTDVGVGYQYTNGKRTIVIGPIVFVSKKIPTADLKPQDQIPKKLTANGEEYRIDIIEISPLTPACKIGDPTTQLQTFDPVPGGVAIAGMDSNGNIPKGRRGSTGAVVKAKNVWPPVTYMLTCTHIIDRNYDVQQPWTTDPKRNVGHWVHSFGDASICEINNKSSKIHCLGKIKEPVSANVGMKVKKSGAGTGVTNSEIIFESKGYIFMDNNPPAKAAGSKRIYLDDGDSGSVSLLGNSKRKGDFGYKLNQYINTWVTQTYPISPKKQDKLRDILNDILENRILGLNSAKGKTSSTFSLPGVKTGKNVASVFPIRNVLINLKVDLVY